MLAAGAFRWHWLSKVGDELADLWVLKLEQWYICRQEGFNQLAFKVFLRNWNEGLLPSQLYLQSLRATSFVLPMTLTLKRFSQLTVWPRENAKQVTRSVCSEIL